MRDESLVEQFAVPEFFVDGYSDFVTRNGVMSCAGYRIQDGFGDEPRRVVVVRLVWPAAATDDAIADAREAQSLGGNVPPAGRVGRH